jgi:ABC-2 type transport system ATP-binding protein
MDPAEKNGQVHSQIGYMPQRFGLYEDLTVMQNLSLYGELQGVDKKTREQRFDELLHFAGLEPFTQRLAKDLSGGMKQKLGLACVLIKGPKLLLLDEPTVGVDPISRRQLWVMTESLVKEGTTVLWSTSYLDEAEKCSLVLLLREGDLLFVGEPEDYTKKAEGKVFSFPEEREKKRERLKKLAEQPSVIDVAVHGDALRLILKNKENLPFALSEKIREVTPRFEDAFIASLTTEKKGNSSLMALSSEEKTGDGIVIEALQLSKSFGHFKAVNSMTFTVKQGEIFGLLGPNGAGKSTTFKMLCGLMQPTSGQASVMGLSLQRAPAKARAKIGYMAQKFSLYGDLSAKQNLKFFSSIYPVPYFKREKVIDEMIDIFELKPILSLATKDIPLGYKQRLALACSLMHKPKILFLDEPTSGVDPLTRREFWNHINNLVSQGMTVMITTHFMEEAEYCDRIALINEGQLVTLGSPDALKASVKSASLTSPTLEDAFIILSEKMRGDLT